MGRRAAKKEREEAMISAFMKQYAAALDAGTDAFIEQCTDMEFPPELDKRCRALIQQAAEMKVDDADT